MLNALKRASRAELLRPHRRRVIWILLLTLFVSAASAIEPLILK